MKNIYEGDFSTLPTVLPVDQQDTLSADRENSIEEQIYEQLEAEVECGWRDPEEAEAMFARWHERRLHQFGEGILRAS